jgi:hypothetical protein
VQLAADRSRKLTPHAKIPLATPPYEGAQAWHGQGVHPVPYGSMIGVVGPWMLDMKRIKGAKLIDDVQRVQHIVIELDVEVSQ